MRLSDDWDNILTRKAAETAPVDAWGQIEMRRAVETAPADASFQIELRKAAEILARPTVMSPTVMRAAPTTVMVPSAQSSDPWARIEARRGVEASTFSHAKNVPWPLLMAAAFGSLILINLLNEGQKS